MPRVTRTTARPRPRPSRTVNDRPSYWHLLLRRQKWLLRPAAWGVTGFVAVLAVLFIVHSVQPGSAIAAARGWLGSSVSLRVTDIQVEGRTITPEPLLRAALGVNKDDPLLGVQP